MAAWWGTNAGESLDAVLARTGVWLHEVASTERCAVVAPSPPTVRALVVRALGAPTPVFWRLDIAGLSVSTLRRARLRLARALDQRSLRLAWPGRGSATVGSSVGTPVQLRACPATVTGETLHDASAQPGWKAEAGDDPEPGHRQAADTTRMEDATATTTLQRSVDELTSTVDYLRVTIGAPEEGWLLCDRLAADADHLAAVVANTTEARGTARADVATSLFVQGYVFRIATVAVGSWVMADAVIDVDPVTTAIALGCGRPNAVRLAEATTVATFADVHQLHAAVIERHLAPIVATAHAACRVGAALLWGNVAASCAAAFSAFAGAPSLIDRRGEIADRAEAFFVTARPEVRNAGTVVRVGDRCAWERRTCCLWYRTDSGFMCEDCSLRPAEEHQARYASMAEVSP